MIAVYGESLTFRNPGESRLKTWPSQFNKCFTTEELICEKVGEKRICDLQEDKRIEREKLGFSSHSSRCSRAGRMAQVFAQWRRNA